VEGEFGLLLMELLEQFVELELMLEKWMEGGGHGGRP
jgi:hypothetical protein